MEETSPGDVTVLRFTYSGMSEITMVSATKNNNIPMHALAKHMPSRVVESLDEFDLHKTKYIYIYIYIYERGKVSLTKAKVKVYQFLPNDFQL